MLIAVFAVAVTLAVCAALLHLRKDETAVRRLRRSEYEPLVKNLWWH